MKLKFALGLMVAAIAVLAMACGGDKEPAAAKPTAATKEATTAAPAASKPAATPAPTPSAPASSAAAVTVTMVDGPSYGFTPKRIEVAEGTVIKLVASKEFHTFTVKDLGIDQIMAAGANAEVKVPTGKKGTFKLVCLPHESLGMVGEVVVK